MRNQLIENLLDNEQVEYDYLPMIETDAIDRKKSGLNQARRDSIVKDNVAAMRQSLQNGIELPALVAYEDRPGIYVLMDGNNRLAAFDHEGINETDIYIVKVSDPSRRVALTYMFNPLNGVNTPPEQAAEQAVHLLAHGYSAKQAAAILRTNTAFVNEARVASQGADRARRLNILSRWDKIASRGSRAMIQRSVSLDLVFVGVVRTVAAYDLTAKETKKLVEGVAALGSQEAQLQHIANEVRELKRAKNNTGTTRKARRIPAPTQMFRANMAYVGGVDPQIFRGMDEDQRNSMLALVAKGINNLSTIERQLQSEVV